MPKCQVASDRTNHERKDDTPMVAIICSVLSWLPDMGFIDTEVILAPVFGLAIPT